MSWHEDAHIGRPTSGEEYRSRHTSKRLEVCLSHLQDQGFARDEALAFLVGVAYEISRGRGETWHNLSNASKTVEGLLVGHAAKTWSLDAVDLAVNAANELLEG